MEESGPVVHGAGVRRSPPSPSPSEWGWGPGVCGRDGQGVCYPVGRACLHCCSRGRAGTSGTGDLITTPTVRLGVVVVVVEGVAAFRAEFRGEGRSRVPVSAPLCLAGSPRRCRGRGRRRHEGRTRMDLRPGRDCSGSRLPSRAGTPNPRSLTWRDTGNTPTGTRREVPCPYKPKLVRLDSGLERRLPLSSAIPPSVVPSRFQ